MDYYRVLSVASNADEAQISRAYINICRRYKSTLNYGPEISFEVVHEAYKTLSDPELRRAYDASLILEDNISPQSTVTVASADVSAVDVEWGSKDYSGIKEWVHDFRVPTKPTFKVPVETTNNGSSTSVATMNVRNKAGVVESDKLPSTGRNFFLGLLIFFAFMGIPAGAAFWSSVGMNAAAAVSFSLLGACLFSIACLKTTPGGSDPAPKNVGKRRNYAAPKQRVYQNLSPSVRRNLMDADFALKCKIWGMPGVLDDAVEKFGQRNIDLGSAGEELTATMLEGLLKIPGTRIFHGLKFPGSMTADVDHAVINGDKIVFIDSKMWIGAHYKWVRPDTIGRARRKEFKEIHTNFPAAVGYLSQTFNKQQIMALTVIHPNNHYHVSVDNTHATNVLLTTGPDAIKMIGNWFARDLTGKIDLNSMQKLEYQLK